MRRRPRSAPQRARAGAGPGSGHLADVPRGARQRSSPSSGRRPRGGDARTPGPGAGPPAVTGAGGPRPPSPLAGPRAAAAALARSGDILPAPVPPPLAPLLIPAAREGGAARGAAMGTLLAFVVGAALGECAGGAAGSRGAAGFALGTRGGRAGAARRPPPAREVRSRSCARGARGGGGAGVERAGAGRLRLAAAGARPGARKRGVSCSQSPAGCNVTPTAAGGVGEAAPGDWDGEPERPERWRREGGGRD